MKERMERGARRDRRVAGGIRQRKADNHVFDISVFGERERMGEKKMNRQGIRGLKRRTASLMMLSLLNASGWK